MLLHAQSATQYDDLLAAKKLWSSRVFRTPRDGGFRALAAASSPTPDQNVVGVGIGEKFDDRQPTGVLALKFFVSRKYTPDELSRKETLPKSIDGLPVDVEETGVFQAFAAKKRKAAPAAATNNMPNPKARYRPAQPGCSIGFEFPPSVGMVMAGTFGAVVQDGAGRYILSNNHVLADEGNLKPGADIFQPGLLDGGNPSTDQVAKLTRFIPLQPGGAMNKVDCAIAKGNTSSVLSPAILHIGPPAGTANAALDMRVHKFGRTTSYTVGHITSIATDVTVTYGAGNINFEDQIIIVGDSGPFSAAGDSGSLILERQSNNAVGLLFAGSSTHTICNHLSDVLAALQVTMV